MLFLVVLQNYVVLHTKSGERALHTAEDENDQISIVFESSDGFDGLYFPLNAEVTIDPEDPCQFTVTDIDDTAVEFNAYTPANLSGGFTTSNNPDDPNRLNVQVGKFDVLLNHTHEGIIVDVWPHTPDYNGESLGTVAVQNDDLTDIPGL